MKLFHSTQCGRSMIEMLGVLAIVGILSVGGIAGYSKAMRTYKVNKTTEEFSLLINELLNFKPSLIKLEKNYNLVPIVQSLNILPKTWETKEDNKEDKKQMYIYDSLSRRIRPFVRERTSPDRIRGIGIDYELKFSKKDSSPGADVQLLCQNIWLNLIKAYDDSIYYAFIWRGDGNTSILESFGKNFCHSQNRKCISDITVSDAATACSSCLDENECIIGIDFY